MNNDYTHIIMVLDRSGSMQSLTADTIGSYNRFLKEQKEVPGKATISLFQFNHEVEATYVMKPLEEASGLSSENYAPMGYTAMNDAIGKAIHDTGRALAAMPQDERPAKVVCVIITDGYENSSVEYKGPAGTALIRELIKHHEEKYSWQFLFLGANIDVARAAESIGVAGAQSLAYDASSRGVQHSYDVASHALRSYRSADAGAKLAVSEEDRKKAEDILKGKS